jgi:hypothetical protein
MRLEEKYLFYLNALYIINKSDFYRKANEIEFYDEILFDCYRFRNIFNYLYVEYKDKINIGLRDSYDDTILHSLIKQKQYDLFKLTFNLFKDKMKNELYDYCIEKIKELGI